MLPGGLLPGGSPRGSSSSSLLRWLGVRLWARRRLLLVALLWFGSWLFLNGLVLVQRSILSDFCTEKHSRQILSRLCGEFRDGSVSGDMCSDLCEVGLLQFRRCLYYENGKKVMEAEWRGSTVILKSKMENFSSYEPLNILEYQDTAEELSPMDVVLYATMEVRNSLGLTEEEEDEDGDGGGGGEGRGRGGGKRNISRLWGEELRKRGRGYSRAELSSLWALLQQEEYTFLRVLQDLSPHVARVLGSCGHFYAVEYLSAGHTWNQNLFSVEGGQVRGGGQVSREQVNLIALSFLHMVKHFENDFVHKLHLCDIKPENFAIRSDLTVVAIDVDMAFFEPKMREILEQNCSSDDDCNFFDCSSRCETKKQRCSATRRNSNLQVICEKIFRPWFSPTLLGAKAGLPLQVELQRAVQECSETDGGEEEEGGRGGRGEDVHLRLLNILNRLLEEGGGSSERGGGRHEEEDHVHTALNF
ncbi:hypothetical protein CgunFtcFv8_015172 [Champsocephalus gunnari]|nr:hypothetical protein CgunFtcFv8_015172 [Champsocephalus gunnari]